MWPHFIISDIYSRKIGVAGNPGMRHRGPSLPRGTQKASREVLNNSIPRRYLRINKAVITTGLRLLAHVYSAGPGCPVIYSGLDLEKAQRPELCGSRKHWTAGPGGHRGRGPPPSIPTQPLFHPPCLSPFCSFKK